MYRRRSVVIKCADVAQLVERLFCKQRVGGSNPLVGFKYFLFFINKMLIDPVYFVLIYICLKN